MIDPEMHGSKLLNALNPDDRQSLAPRLEKVALGDGHVIYRPGDEVDHVFFPCGQALASHVVTMGEGQAIEAALVGNEGAIGGIVSHGSLPAYAGTVVTHGGDFYRIAAHVLQEIKEGSPQMAHLFACYADCLVAQLMQSIACNATHSIEQRAAKWLGAAVDRTGSSDVSLTQDQLGILLGVGRTYVSRIVGQMKREGIITTRRGGIAVKDRAALDQVSCNCRQLVNTHFATVMAGVYHAQDML